MIKTPDYLPEGYRFVLTRDYADDVSIKLERKRFGFWVKCGTSDYVLTRSLYTKQEIEKACERTMSKLWKLNAPQSPRMSAVDEFFDESGELQSERELPSK